MKKSDQKKIDALRKCADRVEKIMRELPQVDNHPCQFPFVEIKCITNKIEKKMKEQN